jgi:dCTP diphosphatase
MGIAMTDGYRAMMDAIAAFVEERDWDRFHSAQNLALAIASEVGELAGELRWIDDEAAIDRTAVASELADVQVFLLLLARRLDIDLPSEVLSKIAQNEKRYPVREWKGRAGKA